MLADRLLSWFDSHARAMPWRERRDAYAVWVSEVMLQQTQVATVIPYFERFMQRFPTVEALAEAPIDDVLKQWEGLGYYSRARNLQAAAQRVVAQHGGQWPADWEALRALPGIGDYTAGAIASIAFNLPRPAVDGNVFRVLSRLRAWDDDITRPATRKRFEAEATALIPTGQAWRFNQALMELGATVCLPRHPACEACPWAEPCQARAQGRVAEFPVKGRKIAVREVVFATAVVRDRNGRFLVARRPDQGLLGGLWAFPFFEVDPPELAAAALRQELGDRWGIAPSSHRPLARIPHVFTHRKALFDAHLFELDAAGPALPEPARWAGFEQLDRLALPLAHQKIRAALAAPDQLRLGLPG